LFYSNFYILTNIALNALPQEGSDDPVSYFMQPDL